MSSTKKVKILVPIIIVLFFVAYAEHRHHNKQLDTTGRLRDKTMNEISGIAASGIRDNIYYVHNDSGDSSRLFAITPDGFLKNIIYFKGDPKEPLGVHDCEDIDVSVGPIKGKSYIYLGDIGDNGNERKFLTVYRIEEKKAWDKDSLVKAAAVSANYRYPDGAKDAEAMMVDPIEKLIYIVSKRDDSVGVYTAPLIFKPNDTVTLEKRCKLHFNGFRPFKWITAADISKDGQQVLVKSYEKVYYWKRSNNEPIWKTILNKPQELPYKAEKQGEAIGFTPDGRGYYTTSEGVFAPIYYYKVP